VGFGEFGNLSIADAAGDFVLSFGLSGDLRLEVPCRLDSRKSLASLRSRIAPRKYRVYQKPRSTELMEGQEFRSEKRSPPSVGQEESERRVVLSDAP
jgi:hypothetical protein